jgi:hypothetical protein
MSKTQENHPLRGVGAPLIGGRAGLSLEVDERAPYRFRAIRRALIEEPGGGSPR